MEPILLNNLDKIKTAMQKHRVKSAYAFGSVCTGRFTDSSDIDLLVSFHDMKPVEYSDNYFSLLYSLQQIFNRDVDLITDKSLKNPYFIKVLNNTKISLYE